MISHQVKAGLLAATLLTPVFASESFAGTDANVGAKVIAALNLADGTSLTFQEDASGGLAVMAQGRNPGKSLQTAAINGVSVAKVLRKTPVELYKTATGGSAAPAALVAAQQRADAAAKKASHQTPPPNDVKLPSLATPESSGYCQWDSWRICYPKITGSYYYQKYTYLMDSYISVYYGNSAYHKLSRWNGSYWEYSGYSQWVGAGNWGYVYIYGGYPWKRVDLSGYGSVYAWAITGH
jgi:hypothetical protein